MLGGIVCGINKRLGRGGREGVHSKGAWHDSTNWLYLDISAPPFPLLFSSEYKKEPKINLLGPYYRISAAVGKGSALKVLGRCSLQNKHFHGLLLR